MQDGARVEEAGKLFTGRNEMLLTVLVAVQESENGEEQVDQHFPFLFKNVT